MRMPSDPHANTLRRLQSAAGHLNAVIQMVEHQAPCEEVLHQLGAVQGALKAVGCQILDEYIENSMEIVRENGTPEERSQALEKMLRLVQTQMSFKTP